jgi:hypothetical protein
LRPLAVNLILGDLKIRSAQIIKDHFVVHLRKKGPAVTRAGSGPGGRYHVPEAAGTPGMEVVPTIFDDVPAALVASIPSVVQASPGERGWGTGCVRYDIDGGMWFDATKKLQRWFAKRLSVHLPEKRRLAYYIVYDVGPNTTPQYEIEWHTDNCAVTIVVYMRLDDDVEDEFRIRDGDDEVVFGPESRWLPADPDRLCALAFCGNWSHSGLVKGTGRRAVVVLHFG